MNLCNLPYCLLICLHVVYSSRRRTNEPAAAAPAPLGRAATNRALVRSDAIVAPAPQDASEMLAELK